MKKTYTKKTGLLLCLAVTSLCLILSGCNDDYEDYDKNANDSSYYENEDDDSYHGAAGSDSYYEDEKDSSHPEDDYRSNSYPFGSLGSASEMDGTTVIVSIFMDDLNTAWDFSDSEDTETLTECLGYMDIATAWLSEQCSAYGTQASFLYDWEQNTDLCMTGSVSCDLTNEDDTGNIYYEEMQWVDENIDSDTIMSDYDADNLIYMMYVNTDYSNGCTSGTFTYDAFSEYPYEIVTIYVRCDGEDETPAAYAHEILHTFGAPDLYMADQDGLNYGITQEYVSELENTNSNDIMFTTYDAETTVSYYDHISNEFTELDAYYVGLADSSSVAEQWGFDKSQHTAAE